MKVCERRELEYINGCSFLAEIHKGRLQLYLFVRVIRKVLAWATGRSLARAVGYIYVEAYDSDKEEEVDGMRFEIRYRV